MACIDVRHGGNMLLGHDQKMHRRMRMNIVEGDQLIILVQTARRNLTGDDFAKETITHSVWLPLVLLVLLLPLVLLLLLPLPERPERPVRPVA